MGLTIVEFRNRFTQAEKIAIDLAAIDNPSAPIEQRMMSAGLRVYLADLAAVKDFVEVTDPLTMAGVQTLEAMGIIGPGRAAEILSPTGAPAEHAETFTLPADMAVPGTSLVVALAGTYPAHDLVDCCQPDDPSRTPVARYPAIYIATGEN